MAHAAKAAGSDLNDKQKAFARAYVDSLCATEAAKKAGYAESTAYSQGHRLKTDPRIRAYIDALFEQLDMGRGEVKSRICDIARGDMGDFLDIQGDEDAELVSISLYRAKAARKTRLLRKVKTIKRDMGEAGTSTTVEIELYAADKALLALGRHHRLFDVPEETSDDDEEIEAETKLEAGELSVEAALDV